MKNLCCIALALCLCLSILPGAARQAAAEPLELAAQTGESQAVGEVIAQTLAKEAQSASDVWEKYLLSQPVQNLRVEAGSASFSLPRLGPGGGEPDRGGGKLA